MEYRGRIWTENNEQQRQTQKGKKKRLREKERENEMRKKRGEINKRTIVKHWSTSRSY